MALEGFINQNSSKWMEETNQPFSDVVLSSRIRLARNIHGLPFPSVADSKSLKEVEKIIGKRMSGLEDFKFFSMNGLTHEDKLTLVEKHLISPQLINENKNSGVWLNKDESVSIMVNEEDHIRTQVVLPGLNLEEGYKIADEIDDQLEAHIDFAFSENIGYLTACPTNVGTGLRASVMVHLPALVLTKQINRILTAVSQLGLAVRGIYGEGSESLGNIMQISNQVTLGQSEAEIIDNLKRVTKQIIDHEYNSRKYLLEENQVNVKDKAYRAYGILSNAYSISSKEALELLSYLKLGVDLKFIEGIKPQFFKQLIVITRPGFLQKLYGHTLNTETRDIKRAEVIREILKK
ncbi:protein arginine kinase [Anaerobranca gottschalkii]|uniref:Protein-arginine kinase n=1 Tax=Anaerobranca gottschalkii DSM 13577 TaxID=1120990 RepID=A0A1I0B600_9FIRM|nr:protein arginine kinase [Anaerobranca gottschalkii]SET02126.1 protein arginine kinase [Anaerobranca gottschalkii DSM 13577]